MSEQTPTPTRFRIRWGWFLGCILLGLGALSIGWLVVPTVDRPAYLAEVLAGIGTTLLLVGIVLLLERRIVDTAVRVVRRADRQREEQVQAQVREMEERVAAKWATATPENMAETQAEAAQLINEFTKRIVDEATGRDEPRDGRKP